MITVLFRREFDVTTCAYSHRLDIWHPELAAELRRFIPVELQCVNRHPCQHPLDCLRRFVDKQSHPVHVSRQRLCNITCALGLHITGARRKEVEANGVRARMRRNEAILRALYPTNLDAYAAHLWRTGTAITFT